MSTTENANEKSIKEKSKATGDASLGFLEKMLNLMVKYGPWNIFKAILLIFAFGIVVYSVTNIDKLVEKAFKEQTEQVVADHDNAMQMRKEIKPKMDLIMENALRDLKADRVFVMELHNGTNNTAGLPFVYGEISYERCADGIEPAGDGYTSLVLSRYEFPYILHQKPLWMGSIDEMMTLDRRIAMKLASDDITYLGIAVLHGIDNELGYIGVEYCNGREPIDSETMRNILASDVQKVATLLDVNKYAMSRQ